MAKQLQLRRGTTAQHATFTGAVGEVTIDTDKDVVVVHDGATAGGFPSQKQLVSGTNIKTVNNTSLLGSGDISLPITISVTNIDELKDFVAPYDNYALNVLGYLEAGDGGGGTFYYDATKARTEHNGGTVIAPNSVFPNDWNDQVQLAAWFDGSGLAGTGCWVRNYDGAVNVKWFGAVGDEVADDTAAVFAAITYINDRGGYTNLVVDAGIYNVGTITTSSLPSGGWRDTIKLQTQCVLFLVGVTDVTIMGSGVIRTADNGTPTTSTTNGIFQLSNCHNIRFDGLHINGNRLGQLHTSGTNTGHNHGFVVASDCTNITVENCLIENLGSLRTGTDKRGDALYVRNGAQNIFFRNNVVKNVGRWCCILEDGSGNTINYVIEGNTYYGANRAVPPPNPNDYEQNCLGFVDIEHWNDHGYIFIRNNLIYRSGVISFGGSTASSSSVTVKNVVIEDNTWRSEEIGGLDGYDRVVGVGGSLTATKRTMDGFYFRNNKIYYGSAALGVVSQNRILSLESATFKDVFIENNYIEQYSGDITGGAEAGMNFYAARLLGTIRYANNTIKTTSNRGGWFGLRSEAVASLGTSNFVMYLENNELTNGHHGVFFNPDSTSTASLYAIDNKITSTLSRIEDLTQGIYNSGNTYVYVQQFQSSGFASSVNVRSSVAVGDTLTPAFWITLTNTDAAVLVRVAFTINDLSQSSGVLEFSALNNNGTWTVGTVASQMTNTTPPTVTINGTTLEINMRKASGGVVSRPTIFGVVACAGCRLSAVAP